MTYNNYSELDYFKVYEDLHTNNFTASHVIKEIF